MPRFRLRNRDGGLWETLVFVYHCFDRTIINGYLSGVSPEQVVYFIRDVIGVSVTHYYFYPRAETLGPRIMRVAPALLLPTPRWRP